MLDSQDDALDHSFDLPKPEDGLTPLRLRLHAEIVAVIEEHDLGWKELRDITGDKWTRQTKSRLKKRELWWSAHKYERVAKALGIATEWNVHPVPAPKLNLVLKRRRLAAQYAAAA